MAPAARSWHIPTIDSRDDAQDVINVVFLQRLDEEVRTQMVQNLSEVDEDWANTLDMQVPSPRRVVPKAWIRDYWPSSDVILEIARAAYFPQHGPIFRNLIFCDSGWEAANVIAARWEELDGKLQLNAARVPMSVANVLLTICDLKEGYTLAHVLGSENFEDAKVDFYKDATQQRTNDGDDDDDGQRASGYSWPTFLPADLALSKSEPVIVSLQSLHEDEYTTVLKDIINGDQNENKFDKIGIHNWVDGQATKADLYHIFWRLYENTAEADQDMCALFLDNAPLGVDDRPEVLAATRVSHGSAARNTKGVQTVPIALPNLLAAWKAASSGAEYREWRLYGDMFRKENLFDMSLELDFSKFIG